MTQVEVTYHDGETIIQPFKSSACADKFLKSIVKNPDVAQAKLIP